MNHCRNKASDDRINAHKEDQANKIKDQRVDKDMMDGI